MAAYLYVHQNPNAPKRANGLRFHGYPARTQRIRLIGVHTAESVFDQIGQDTGAEGVAAVQARTVRPSSYHRIVDRDSVVIALPDDATAFGIAGLNSPTLHLSFALRAADWSDPAKARAAEPALRLAAATAAEWCRRYGIPVRRLTKAQADAGQAGFIAHGDADPTRRTDPGRHFPWDRFLDLVRQLLAGGASTTSEEDDDMPKARILNAGGNLFLVAGDLSWKRHIRTPDELAWIHARPDLEIVEETGVSGPILDSIPDASGQQGTSLFGLALTNQDRILAVAAQAAGSDPDEPAIAAALAPLLVGRLSALSDDDVTRIAAAAADEQARRLQNGA